jgi:putative transcriptional regulator
MRSLRIVIRWLAVASIVVGARSAPAQLQEGHESEPQRARPARSRAPAFLVASPQMRDPNFEKAVILLLADDDEGAVGLVLTHPTHVLGAEVGRRLNVPVTGKAASIPVHEGGPVDPERGLVVHGRSDLANDAPLVPGLYIDPPERVLESLLKDGETKARLFVGYAGWGPGQLDAELGRGDWSVSAATPRAVFDIAPDALWETLRRENAGGSKSPARPHKKP